ncbi:hypothetical protein BDQ17DRAFT_1470285 [Cyathus striatus]|nr:hypothetical protein BDQ17DRAFT_1470285 [Cyathus striatus]
MWAWLGLAVHQLPAVSISLGLGTQDTTKLFEAGAQGFPYLALTGTADKLLLNDNITKELQPCFTNVEVHKIQGGSHALFIDNKDEFMQVLIQENIAVPNGVRICDGPHGTYLNECYILSSSVGP